MSHGVMRGFPGKGLVGKAFGTTRYRASGDGGGESWVRTGWLFRVDASLASTEHFSGGDGGGVSRQTGAGAYEGLRCSLLGDRGPPGDRSPWFMRNGDGGLSPRCRLEKRRNMDTFLDNACGVSVAMVVYVQPIPLCRLLLFCGCMGLDSSSNTRRRWQAIGTGQDQSKKARGTARTENLSGFKGHEEWRGVSSS